MAVRFIRCRSSAYRLSLLKLASIGSTFIRASRPSWSFIDLSNQADFQTRYSSTFSNPTAYVDALLQTVGLPNHPGRAGWISTLNSNNNTQTRGQVLRQLVERGEVFNKYFNEAFVIMQYCGYLRRTADASYLNWIQTMNQTNGDYRIMINGFMNSSEYRRRFGP